MLLDAAQTTYVGIRGPAAEALQRNLVETMERLGMTILQLYEGGPETRQAIARARDGRWVSAQEDR